MLCLLLVSVVSMAVYGSDSNQRPCKQNGISVAVNPVMQELVISQQSQSVQANYSFTQMVTSTQYQIFKQETAPPLSRLNSLNLDTKYANNICQESFKSRQYMARTQLRNEPRPCVLNDNQFSNTAKTGAPMSNFIRLYC